VLKEEETVTARADALAAADEGVRRGTRGRAPQFLKAQREALNSKIQRSKSKEISNSKIQGESKVA
jgi:hypothetical protein